MFVSSQMRERDALTSKMSTSSNNPWDGIVPGGDSHMVRW